MSVRAWASAAAGVLLLCAVACRKEAPRPPRWSGPPPYVPAPVIHPGEAPPPVVEPPPVEPPAIVPVEPQPRRFATVQLVGVRMGLGRSDGTAWDFDMGTAPQKEDVRAITAILLKGSEPSFSVVYRPRLTFDKPSYWYKRGEEIL